MKLRPFELALVIIFGALAALALFLLSTYDPDPIPTAETITSPVEIWGTLPKEPIESLLREITETNESFRLVSYRQILPDQFDLTLLNALAERTVPDLLLIQHEQLVEHRSKIQPFSYEFYPQRDFRSRYVEGAEIFMLSDGLYALPFGVDPLMLYWNRDLLTSTGFLGAPATWEQLVGEAVPTLTIRDFSRAVTRASVALGEYQNIKNAFPVLSMLLLQGGSQLVSEGQGGYQVRLNSSLSAGEPFTTALSFYTRFANSSNPLYTWNRTLPLDQELFLREDLALYFGFGSEARELQQKNPNLNFDIAEVPQGAEATVRRTYGRMYGFSLLRNAENQNGAYVVMSILTSDNNLRRLLNDYGLAPAHRSLYQGGSNDLYGRIIYQSGPIARGWLNPDLNRVNEALAATIADLQANRVSERNGAEDASARIRLSY